MSETVDPGQVLRERLFEADLVKLPYPDEGLPGFLPDWYRDELPVLVYPTFQERGVSDGAQVQLEVTPYHIYYGALRELAETADETRAQALQTLVLGWNATAAQEVHELGGVKLEEDPEQALLHFELAHQIDQTLYGPAHDAGLCALQISQLPGQDAESQVDHLETAIDHFSTAISLQPESGMSWLGKAQALGMLGREDEAEETLQEFLDDYPDGEDRALVEQVHTQISLQVEPPPAGALDGVDRQALRALATGEDPAQAVEMLEPLAEAHPQEAEVWFLLGAAYRRLKQLSDAERCLRRSARLLSSEPLIYRELAQTCLDAQLWKDAVDAARRGLQLDPQNVELQIITARALYHLGDLDGARESLADPADVVPDDPEVMELTRLLRG